MVSVDVMQHWNWTVSTWAEDLLTYSIKKIELWQHGLKTCWLTPLKTKTKGGVFDRHGKFHQYLYLLCTLKIKKKWRSEPVVNVCIGLCTAFAECWLHHWHRLNKGYFCWKSKMLRLKKGKKYTSISLKCWQVPKDHFWIFKMGWKTAGTRSEIVEIRLFKGDSHLGEWIQSFRWRWVNTCRWTFRWVNTVI